MKREFKQGDRVLVRRHDLQEWKEGRFSYTDENTDYLLPFFVEMPEGLTGWTQCRHIDDFRTGDKVQVYDNETDEWLDAIYACHKYTYRYGDEHYVFMKIESNYWSWKECRWHPSMPWADKKEQKEEPLSLEQRIAALEALQPKNEYRLEVLERKLNKQ